MPGWCSGRGANCGPMGWWPIPPAGGGPMPMCPGPTMPGGSAPGGIMYGGGGMRYGACIVESAWSASWNDNDPSPLSAKRCSGQSKRCPDWVTKLRFCWHASNTRLATASAKRIKEADHSPVPLGTARLQAHPWGGRHSARGTVQPQASSCRAARRRLQAASARSGGAACRSGEGTGVPRAARGAAAAARACCP